MRKLDVPPFSVSSYEIGIMIMYKNLLLLLTHFKDQKPSSESNYCIFSNLIRAQFLAIS